MQRMILLAVTVFIMLTTVSQAEAKNPEAQEFRRVVVTLNDGTTVEGYVKNSWHADNALLKMKRENYSFTLVPTPDSKEATKYTAEEVRSIEYTEKTESNPDGIRWESRPVAYPNFKSRYNTNRQFVCCDVANNNAALYWWKRWDVTTDRTRQTRRLITIGGIRFGNDSDGIVYPYELVGTMLMDKRNPGLKEFYKQWFKGPEGKVRKNKAKENGAWMLDMYDAYLKQQGQ